MGGKGRRRREKNYLVAHGGNNRLPPPPDVKQLEVLPSKLRKIIELKNYSAVKHVDMGRSSEIVEGKRKRESSDKKIIKATKSILKGPQLAVVNAKPKDYTFEKAENTLVKDKSATSESISDDSKKRKRKRKLPMDLRFEAFDLPLKHSKRKERKKEYLKERKKKHEKMKVDDGSLNFAGHEDIKFGDIVKAPPKLSRPKLPKILTDASKEKLRLKAIDLYRKKKGWESRPGIKLPSFIETTK